MPPTGSPPPARTRRRWPALLALAVTIGAAVWLAPRLAALTGLGDNSGPFPTRVTLARLDTAVTLPTARCGDYFIVEAVINGRGPYPLILDSGAGSTLLDPRVLGEAAPRKHVDSLRIGPFAAFDFDVRPLDTEQLSGALGREVLGVLGQPVLAGLAVTWDYPAGRIELAADTLPLRGPGIVPVRFGTRPFVGAVVDRDTFWMLLDTGSSGGLTLRDPERFATVDALIPTGARVRVDGVHLKHTVRLRGTARVGPLRVERPVATNSVSVDLVGTEVLRHVRLTLDRRAKRARFERPAAPLGEPIPSPAKEASGFALVPTPESARVGWIAESARAAGLREDDVIIGVDDTLWTDRGCRVRTPPSADPVRLDVVRGGDDTLQVTVPVRLEHVDRR